MKIKVPFVQISMAIVPLLVSCASQPIVLAPVGPNPYAGTPAPKSNGPGYLKVFSAQEPITEGEDPAFYQHTDYNIYNEHGKIVKHVFNTVGHYDPSPRSVELPAGSYTIRADAKDNLKVFVPVVLESGRTTSVHLDDHWNPPRSARSTEFVFEPGGAAVGWKAARFGG